MTAKIHDYLGNLIWPDMMIAYGASRGVRYGIVTKVNEYKGDWNTTYTITMTEYLPEGKRRTKTFPYEQYRVVVVGDAYAMGEKRV